MSIEKESKSRKITRLCHFTESRNLAYMHAGSNAILPTGELLRTQQALYSSTDLQRFDGHLDKICCSIEYPNVWYFDKARGNQPIFPDWVVLLIEPSHLWVDGTVFCPCNASKNSGAYIAAGYSAFSRLFAASVFTGQTRGAKHLPCSPTDDQAEVLVVGPISLVSLLGVGVFDQAQAKREFARLQQLGYDATPFTWVIAPHFYEKYKLSAAIRRGERPVETQWLIK
jgi:hypothetical protein